jgi:hypothetical protein
LERKDEPEPEALARREMLKTMGGAALALGAGAGAALMKTVEAEG